MNSEILKVKSDENSKLFLTVLKEILELLEDVVCSICLKILIDPILTRCKHKFCSNCLKNHVSIRGLEATCPVCFGRVNRRDQYKYSSVDYATDFARDIEELLNNALGIDDEPLKIFIKENVDQILLKMGEFSVTKENAVEKENKTNESPSHSKIPISNKQTTIGALKNLNESSESKGELYEKMKLLESLQSSSRKSPTNINSSETENSVLDNSLKLLNKSEEKDLKFLTELRKRKSDERSLKKRSNFDKGRSKNSNKSPLSIKSDVNVPIKVSKRKSDGNESYFESLDVQVKKSKPKLQSATSESLSQFESHPNTDEQYKVIRIMEEECLKNLDDEFVMKTNHSGLKKNQNPSTSYDENAMEEFFTRSMQYENQNNNVENAFFSSSTQRILTNFGEDDKTLSDFILAFDKVKDILQGRGEVKVSGKIQSGINLLQQILTQTSCHNIFIDAEAQAVVEFKHIAIQNNLKLIDNSMQTINDSKNVDIQTSQNSLWRNCCIQTSQDQISTSEIGLQTESISNNADVQTSQILLSQSEIGLQINVQSSQSFFNNATIQTSEVAISRSEIGLQIDLPTSQSIFKDASVQTSQVPNLRSEIGLQIDLHTPQGTFSNASVQTSQPPMSRADVGLQIDLHTSQVTSNNAEVQTSQLPMEKSEISLQNDLCNSQDASNDIQVQLGLNSSQGTSKNVYLTDSFDCIQTSKLPKEPKNISLKPEEIDKLMDVCNEMRLPVQENDFKSKSMQNLNIVNSLDISKFKRKSTITGLTTHKRMKLMSHDSDDESYPFAPKDVSICFDTESQEEDLEKKLLQDEDFNMDFADAEKINKEILNKNHSIITEGKPTTEIEDEDIFTPNEIETTKSNERELNNLNQKPLQEPSSIPMDEFEDDILLCNLTNIENTIKNYETKPKSETIKKIVVNHDDDKFNEDNMFEEAMGLFTMKDQEIVPPPAQFQDCDADVIESSYLEIDEQDIIETSTSPKKESATAIENKTVYYTEELSMILPTKSVESPKKYTSTQCNDPLTGSIFENWQTPAPKLSLCGTRLFPDQINKIERFTKRFQGSYSNFFSMYVTHMILNTNEDNRVQDYTIKFVSGVAAGIWMLSFNWIEECLKQDSLLYEGPFEVLDTTGIAGPKYSRLYRKTKPLFKGFKIFAAPPFKSASQSDIQNIITMLGGTVIQFLDEFLEDNQNISLIITDSRTSSNNLATYNDWLEKYKTVTVDLEWLSCSVGQYKINNLRKFILCDGPSIENLPYPPELIKKDSLLISQSLSFFGDSEQLTLSPICKDKNINSTYKFRKRTSTPNKPGRLFVRELFPNKPVIACTRLTQDQIDKILALTTRNLATYSNTFTTKVTHMIVNAVNNNRIKDYTIKFVSAIAAGIWVVNFNWIEDCLEAKAIISEENYEILDVTGIPGPKEARLNRMVKPLLKGYKIYAAGPFISATRSNIEEIITMLGGSVVDKPEDLSVKNGFICLIITDTQPETQDCDQYEHWLNEFKVITVDLEWLSRSVGQYRLINLRRYMMCSDDDIEKLGYPSDLIENVPYTSSQDILSV